MDRRNRGWLLSVLAAGALLATVAWADQPGREQHSVNWLAGPCGRIKAVSVPQGNAMPLLVKPRGQESAGWGKTAPSIGTTPGFDLFSGESGTLQSFVNVIDSPPVAGFIPQIAIAITDARSNDDDLIAQTESSVVGRHLTNSPPTDFTIGLFDTGAGVHLMSYAGAQRTGIFAADLLTPNVSELAGATGSAFAIVSQPLGLFIDGLAAIDANTMTLDESNMVGQSNVSILVGDEPLPDTSGLPTAIGPPMSVNFVTAIFNDHPIAITYDGNDYTSPDIRFYTHGDPRIPDYAKSVPLNLLPTGAADVGYFPDFDALVEDFTARPASPSTIGTLLQSLFFVASVDLQDGTRTAIDRTGFMLDTGAQVTVIGSRVASRLGLDPAKPEFEVEIEDASGATTMEPGFYVDSLEIPALGEWLSFTNVPVVLLDIASPEGGTLDGIIGMNLFVDFNLVLHGGGLLMQAPPSLAFERIPARLAADIAPPEGDGVVDWLDFAALAQAWLSKPGQPNWYPKADLAPPGAPDGVIDFQDLEVLARSWLARTTP